MKIFALTTLAISCIGCFDNINGPLIHKEKWHITKDSSGTNYSGPYPDCPPHAPKR